MADEKSGAHCNSCGRDEVYVHHANSYCSVAGALHFDAPDPELTLCNTKDCATASCHNCGQIA